MSKKYRIIYADPPWSYYNDSNAAPDCTTVCGMRRPPYPVMSSSAIMGLRVDEITETDSILFIWTTDYHLERCLQVINAWGFIYKTVGFVWVKKNKSGNPVCFMGAYTMKSGVELCLLATKGVGAHRLVRCHNIRSLIESKRLNHSKKPEEVKERIVKLCGDIPRLELFSRQKTPGWDVWGDEVASDIELKSNWCGDQATFIKPLGIFGENDKTSPGQNKSLDASAGAGRQTRIGSPASEIQGELPRQSYPEWDGDGLVLLYPGGC